MNIKVSIKSPKRLAGEYRFNSFTELVEWVYLIFPQT